MAINALAYQADTTEEVGAWVATKIIPRGNRLNSAHSHGRIIRAERPRISSTKGLNFTMLEALRDIMPGDKLRRSAVKMAPAVRKKR